MPGPFQDTLSVMSGEWDSPLSPLETRKIEALIDNDRERRGAVKVVVLPEGKLREVIVRAGAGAQGRRDAGTIIKRYTKES